MKILSNIWVWVVSIISGIGVIGVVTIIVKVLFRRAINKVISKMLPDEQEKRMEKFENNLLDRVKTTAFSQNIQPIVESEIKKVAENLGETIDGKLGEVSNRSDNLLGVVKAIGNFFLDGQIPESKKQEYQEAVKKAEGTPTPTITPIIEEKIVVKAEQPKKAKRVVR